MIHSFFLEYHQRFSFSLRCKKKKLFFPNFQKSHSMNWQNERNGPIPVPGPIMTRGVVSSASAVARGEGMGGKRKRLGSFQITWNWKIENFHPSTFNILNLFEFWEHCFFKMIGIFDNVELSMKFVFFSFYLDRVSDSLTQKVFRCEALSFIAENSHFSKFPIWFRIPSAFLRSEGEHGVDESDSSSSERGDTVGARHQTGQQFWKLCIYIFLKTPLFLSNFQNDDFCFIFQVNSWRSKRANQWACPQTVALRERWTGGRPKRLQTEKCQILSFFNKKKTRCNVWKNLHLSNELGELIESLCRAELHQSAPLVFVLRTVGQNSKDGLKFFQIFSDCKYFGN